MVPTPVAHPSVKAYRKGCRCRDCTNMNTVACQAYRELRAANGGLLLSDRNRRMPSLITRLRREVGIIVAWKAGG